MTSEVESPNMDARLTLAGNRLPKSLRERKKQEIGVKNVGTETSEVFRWKLEIKTGKPNPKTSEVAVLKPKKQQN